LEKTWMKAVLAYFSFLSRHFSPEGLSHYQSSD
jgi:hypothetical protein